MPVPVTPPILAQGGVHRLMGPRTQRRPRTPVPQSWEKTAAAAVAQAGQSLRELRVAEVSELDLSIDNGAVSSYRAKVKVSFKYEVGS